MADALEKFMQGMLAAVMLLNKAIEKQSAMECIVLMANLIDGSLRIGLILREQMNSKSNTIDESLLTQRDTDRPLSERAVYTMCLDAGVIDQSIYQQLSDAYDKRNKCIHRYLLSDINYDYATMLVFELDNILEKVKAAIGYLEQCQIEHGIGITAKGSAPTKAYLIEFAKAKEKPYNLTN
jgi:hypothetical protein